MDRVGEIKVRRLGAAVPPPAAHLAAIVESSRDAILSVTPEGTILSWNRGAELVYGYVVEEAIGQPLALVVPDGVPDPLLDQLQHLRSAEPLPRHEVDAVHVRKDGRRVDVAPAVSPIRGPDGAVDAGSVIARDISERKQAERCLAELANQDDLTGLANRRRFHEQLQHHLDRCARQGWRGVLLLLDLDRIKRINDSLGHGAGDQVIKQSATHMARRLRREDVIGRLGGDEFGVLLADGNGRAIEAVSADLLGALRKAGNVTTSIGAALIDGPLSVEELMIRADVALYCAKDRGGDEFAVYEESMDVRFRE
jgi:diguanylate cyclase (GGDEF)-like protein/PAS domain S-box-containing protein